MRKSTFFIFLFLFFGRFIFAAEPAFKIPDLVSPMMDEAGVVEPQTSEAVTSALQVLKEKSGTQITVFVFSSLENQSIEDIGIKAADQWKLGQKGKTGSSDQSLDRGVIFLVAVKEHKMRIEVGRGLEANLTDITAKNIIDEKIAPLFKEGRMSEGVLVGVYEIAKVTDPDVDLTPYLKGRRSMPTESNGKGGMPLIEIIFLILIFVIGVIRIGGGRGGGGFFFGGGGFGGGSGGGGWSGGGGGFNGGGASGDW